MKLNEAEHRFLGRVEMGVVWGGLAFMLLFCCRAGAVADPAEQDRVIRQDALHAFLAYLVMLGWAGERLVRTGRPQALTLLLAVPVAAAWMSFAFWATPVVKWFESVALVHMK